MSIQTEINRLNTAKTDILNSIKNKGVDTSSAETLSDVPSLIDNITANEDLSTELTTQESLLDSQTSKLSIAINTLKSKASGGTTPEGTLDITENGTYDVTNYASATVNVAGSSEDVYEGLLNNTITKIDSNITSLVAYACRGLSKLKTVNLPNATSIGTYAFYYCTAMTSINAPKVTSLGNYSFYNCGAIKEVNFPLATGIGQNTFYSCGGLERADFGVASKINQASFAYCENLKALILRRTSSICTLAVATNGFQDSAIANGTGYVYVPKALLSDDDATKDYRRATNWSNYASQFRAIEDYPEICGEV